MKKIINPILILTLIASLVSVSGCKKTTINGHVQTVTTNGNVTSYQYDGQGRLTTYSSPTLSFTVVYSQSSVTVTSNGNATIYTLNAQGYASSDNGGGTYSYDGSGNLITEVFGTNTSSFGFSNEDVTTITQNGSVDETFTYTSTSDYRDYGVYFLGKTGIYPATLTPKSYQLVNTDNTGGVTLQYSYTYDSHGRVQSQTVTGGGGTTLTTFTYTTN